MTWKNFHWLAAQLCLFYMVIANQGYGIFGFIEEVKVDFITHPYPLIRPQLNKDGIRMFSIEDMIAMKVQAILGRGRKKAFWDIAELLHHYIINDFINFHKELS